jgi:hypothetical protein
MSIRIASTPIGIESMPRTENSQLYIIKNRINPMLVSNMILLNLGFLIIKNNTEANKVYSINVKEEYKKTLVLVCDK